MRSLLPALTARSIQNFCHGKPSLAEHPKFLVVTVKKLLKSVFSTLSYAYTKKIPTFLAHPNHVHVDDVHVAAAAAARRHMPRLETSLVHLSTDDECGRCTIFSSAPSLKAVKPRDLLLLLGFGASGSRRLWFSNLLCSLMLRTVVATDATYYWPAYT